MQFQNNHHHHHNNTKKPKTYLNDNFTLQRWRKLVGVQNAIVDLILTIKEELIGCSNRNHATLKMGHPILEFIKEERESGESSSFWVSQF